MSATTAAPPRHTGESTEERIVALGRAHGFAAVGIADIALDSEAAGFKAWIAADHHGEMEYMARHGDKRWRPDELQPGTQSVICVAMNYWPQQAAAGAPAPRHGDGWPEGALSALDLQADSRDRAYVSRYALGRDYHKVLRNRLQAFAEAINTQVVQHEFRVFTDSAPVMEIPLAIKAGLGWRGKHTLLLNRERGSFFFLGDIYTSLKLSPPADEERARDHCGSCRACMDVCPTQAIVAPHRLDARRCISYLTIELKGAIPEELRKPIGNRIYGCDDCQLVCPWNKFARTASVPDFEPRNGLDAATLVELFAWTEADFNERLQGSPIRRIGHERWLRNIAVALGNAPKTVAVRAALAARAQDMSALVREHVEWALAQCSCGTTD